MTFRRCSLASMVTVATVVCHACGGGSVPGESAGYAQGILAARAAKDAAFRSSSQPIPLDRVDEFLPLAYFPPDPDYIVPASLKLSPERTVVEMPTSTGTVRQMERVGVLEFTVKGRQLSLAAFVDADSKDVSRFSVFFSDLTSGTETYAAGRYIDLDRTPTGIYILDFNKAYHPYCYYNPTYECPYPPSENRLQLPIRAGERSPASKATGY